MKDLDKIIVIWQPKVTLPAKGVQRWQDDKSLAVLLPRECLISHSQARMCHWSVICQL